MSAGSLEPRSRDDEPYDPFVGTSYRLIKQLAKGGMGQVEAQCLGALCHPNIVKADNFGLANDGRPFIVMEYLRGQDLGQALARGQRFTIGQSIELMLQACAALSTAHAIGIIHRDIKPENLFLHEQHDGTKTLKLLDFGLARIIPGISPDSPAPLAHTTAVGGILGSIRYASPEGVRGQLVDGRADIYSLGLVFYRLLAQRGPYDDDLPTTGQIVARLTEAPRSPSYFAPGPIPPELDRLVLKALCRSPDERYQSAAEFSAALTQVKRQLCCARVTKARAGYGRLRVLRAKKCGGPALGECRRGTSRGRPSVIQVVLVMTVLIAAAILVARLARPHAPSPPAPPADHSDVRICLRPIFLAYKHLSLEVPAFTACAGLTADRR
jgi:serine/threonine-protein kinase